MYDFESLKDTESVDFAMQMPVQLHEDLAFVSDFCGRDQEYLVNCYIANGLNRIMIKIKKEKFLAHAKKVLEENQVSKEAIEEIVNKFIY